MSWDPLYLQHIGERPQVRPTIGDAGIVYPGKRHVFSGPQESAKTIAAYATALEEVRSGNGGVLLIDLEMGQWDARDRLRDMGATDDDLDAIPYIAPETPTRKETEAAYGTMQYLAADYNLSLVIIDAAAGAYALEDLDDNKRADAETFADRWIRPWWQAGIATIVIDHVVKNHENRGKYAIGSERKIGGVDVHLGFEAIGEPLHRGGHAAYKVTTHKDRPGWLPRPRAAELELDSDPDTHAITWTWKSPSEELTGAGNFRPTILMDRVLEHVGEPWYEPMTRSALAGAVRGKREYLLQAVDCLLTEGRLTLDGKKVVPVPRNVPGTSPAHEGNGNVPRSSPLQGERFSGTQFEGAP